MNWYTLFRQHILDRGIEYYEDGYVKDFSYSDDEIVAQVEGTDVYDISFVTSTSNMRFSTVEGVLRTLSTLCPHFSRVFIRLSPILST